MKRKLVVAIAGLLVFATVATPVASGFLSDVAGHWAAAVITALEAKGLINGGTDGRYQPNQPLTRAQLAKLLVVGLGYQAEADELSRSPSRFVDVPVWHWARGYIEVMAELGMAEGYPDGGFGPDQEVTRAEMAAFIIRAAGLADRARSSRTEVTSYKDDASIPSWARGAIFVAGAEGLMMGLPDGHFYLDRSVTRAEGAAVLYRLLGWNGSLFQLAGTLVRYDRTTLSGVVRDAMGEERSFAMAPDATYFRQGEAVSAAEIQRLDQVFIMLDEQGLGRFLEGRYVDLLAEEARLAGDQLELLMPGGETQRYRVQPGALIMLNGRPAPLANLDGAAPVYAALDDTTGEIRLVEALRGARSGVYIGFLDDRTRIRLLVENQEQIVPLAAQPIVLIDGQRKGLEKLLPGDEVRFVVDESGSVSYLEVAR